MAKVVYMCDECGKLFNTEAGAEKCERSHKPLKAVKSSKYSDLLYPDEMLCVMSDGAEVRYVLKSVEKMAKNK